MPDDDAGGSAQIQTALGSVSFSGKRMAEFISVLLAIAFAVFAYVLWDHANDSRANATEYKSFLREIAETNQKAIAQMVEVQKSNVSAQREMNCLIALPVEKREKEFFSSDSFCKRMARER